MENKGYEMWKEWMIQDSILFDELIKEENKTEYGDKENLSQHTIDCCARFKSFEAVPIDFELVSKG